MVTAQAVVSEMHDQIGRAALAGRRPAAGNTGENVRVAATVEKNEALLGACQALLDGCEHGGRESVPWPVYTRVDAAHKRQSGTHERALA